jgi:3-oxoacyl-[acyl-carrier protein] reductase
MDGIEPRGPEQDTNSEAPLRGRVALVTGGSRGIGLAIAGRVAKMGAAVAICARDPGALEAAERQIKESGGSVYASAADVSKRNDVENLIKEIRAKLGTISILVNNAGIGIFGPVEERSDEDWEQVLDTNLKSVFLVSRAVIPGMRRIGSGDIINISSLAGRNAFKGGAIYCASKWGLQGLTACMAEDLRDDGIRVAAVLPGSVATTFSGKTPADKPKGLVPGDVAHAVAMLLTQRAGSFISEVQLRPLQK